MAIMLDIIGPQFYNIITIEVTAMIHLIHLEHLFFAWLYDSTTYNQHASRIMRDLYATTAYSLEAKWYSFINNSLNGCFHI